MPGASMPATMWLATDGWGIQSVYRRPNKICRQQKYHAKKMLAAQNLCETTQRENLNGLNTHALVSAIHFARSGLIRPYEARKTTRLSINVLRVVKNVCVVLIQEFQSLPRNVLVLRGKLCNSIAYKSGWS